MSEFKQKLDKIDQKYKTPYSTWKTIGEKPEWREYDLNFIRELIEHIKIDKQDNLKTLIEESKDYILTLPQNWDGYDADTIEINVLNRATILLKNVCSDLWKKTYEIPLPIIAPVPDGSIDINWENEKFELLINVPKNENDLTHLYGEHIHHPEHEIDIRSPSSVVKASLLDWFELIYNISF